MQIRDAGDISQEFPESETCIKWSEWYRDLLPVSDTNIPHHLTLYHCNFQVDWVSYRCIENLCGFLEENLNPAGKMTIFPFVCDKSLSG
jgi:hypothetical protein